MKINNIYMSTGFANWKAEFITYFTLITSIFSLLTLNICSCQATIIFHKCMYSKLNETERDFIPETFNIPHSTYKVESTTLRAMKALIIKFQVR